MSEIGIGDSNLASPLQLDEVQPLNGRLEEQLECLGLSEKRNNKRIEQIQKQVRPEAN